VICVSEATRADVVERWGVAVERTVVARHGAGQLEGVTVERAAEPRHYLYVGDDEPRKNLDALLDAYAAYRGMRGSRAAPLVLAGKTARAATDGVELVSRPSRERLAALHAGAIALVHPAVEEGFGLTLLEALAAVTPVFAARSRAAIEVCGDDAAVLLGGSGRDGLVAQLAVQLAAIQFDVSKREQLVLAGQARSREFSWAASARAHIEAYTLAAR
jgi:glycosyltransferase involved in cell wall biosynthesis